MKKILIVGAGGFGREMLQWIKDINSLKLTWDILGFIDDNLLALDNIKCDYTILSTIKEYNPNGEYLVIAIANPKIKEIIVGELLRKGAKFASIIHPSARIGDYSNIGQGLVMYPNSYISVNSKIGDFVSILSSTIGHDVKISDFSTISSHCDICGEVQIGKKVYLGSHVTIVPKIKIGDNAYLCAGSVVMMNIKESSKVLGNPARKFQI